MIQFLPAHKNLQAQGDYVSLLEEFARLSPRDPRWFAVRARFAALQRQTDSFSEFRSSALELVQETATLCELAIADSIFERNQGLYEESLKSANKAIELAKTSGESYLLHDALFSVACTYSESGEIFRALDLFQRIATIPDVSKYRKNISELNVAWLLWDLGQVYGLEDWVRNHPGHVKALRAELMLAMLACDFKKCEQLLRRPLADLSEQTLLIPLIQILEICTSSRAPQRQTFENSWRDQVEGLFLDLLKKDQNEFRLRYENELDPLLAKHRINTPLIPRFHILKQGQWPWHRWLLKEQNQESAAVEIGLVAQRLIVSGPDLQGEIDLTKKPMTLRLLRILIYSSDTLNKKHIHEQLTGSKYVSHLHDPRIYKLVLRLNQDLKREWGITPWSFNNDNQVVLSEKIQIRTY